MGSKWRSGKFQEILEVMTRKANGNYATAPPLEVISVCFNLQLKFVELKASSEHGPDCDAVRVRF